MRRVFAAGGLLAAMTAALWAQGQAASQTPPPQREQPDVTFRLDVNYVEVDAIVTDEKGNLVRDLTPADFQVLEDGRPQPVTVFSLVDIPIEREERPLFRQTAVEPDVRSNAKGFEGRLFLVVLDDLHTGFTRSTLVKRAAHEFVDQYVGANDLVAVLHTSGRADASQDFTSSRRLLDQSIDRFMGRKAPSATLSKIDQYYSQGGTSETSNRLLDPNEMERGYQARSMLVTLKSLSELVAGIRGRRKAVVLFSEGIDYDITDPFNNKYASTIIDETQNAIAAATQSNVNFFTVDPRGLTDMGDVDIEVQSYPRDRSVSRTSLFDEMRLSQDSLRVLADQTGGFAAVNSNDFGTAFSRIIRETSTYYVLGYYSTNDKRNGKFRKIDVKITHPGYTVKARKGYVAPRGKPEAKADAGAGTSEALREALASPLPVSGLTLSAFAVPFKGTSPNASVLVSVEVSGTDFAFAERNGRFVDSLEMSLVAVDGSGKVKGGDRNTVNLDLRPQTQAILLQHGVRFTSRLAIPPGRYQLRIAAREQNAARVGSVMYDLEVPDFTDGALTMSGLVLTSAGAARTPSARTDEEIAKVLPAQPTTARTFAESDTLALFTEIYDNKPGTPHAVDITTTLRADDGRQVFKTEDVRKSDELGGVRGGYGYSADVPLKGVAPGLYVLRVEARSRLDGEAQVREIQFRVVTGPSGQVR